MAERVIPPWLCGRQNVGSHELPDLRAHPAEDVPPAPVATPTKHGRLHLVHLHVPGERRLPGEDPPPPRIPPPSQRPAGELSDGWHGRRLPEGPEGGGRG